jgi:hypothetical protein
MQFERFYNLNHNIVAWFAHLQHLGPRLKANPKQCVEKVCGGNGVSVQPYVHPQQMKVLKQDIKV